MAILKRSESSDVEYQTADIKYQMDGQQVVRVSSSELQQNLKRIIKLLSEGCFVELTKHGNKVGMIVPY